MKERDIDDINWKRLISKIQGGTCILILGPEIATAEINGVTKTLEERLANLLAEDIPPAFTIVDRDNLTHVGQQYVAHYGEPDLWDKSADFYTSEDWQPCAIHTNLATLPFRLIINATPDHLMAKAFRKRQGCEVDYYNIRGETKENEIEPPRLPGKPLIYYLYGSPDNPDSLVLTESDLLDFLVKVVSNNPRLPDYITGAFRDKDNCFLFLGVGFKHWHQRVLLHFLQDKNKSTYFSYAVEEMGSLDGVHRQRTYIFFKAKHRLEVFSTRPEDFVRTLKEHYDAAHPDAATLEEDRPFVFISYASEDEAYAKRLHDDLKKQRLEPWLDKTRLEGGDRWDKTIKQSIDQADFVVVLLSKALERKLVSYVNKEIELANERDRYYRDPVKLVFTIKVEESIPPEELAHIQFIDLVSNWDTGINELVKQMSRRYERRKQHGGA